MRNTATQKIANSTSAEPESRVELRILHLIRSCDPRAGGPIEGVIRQSQALKGTVVRELATLDPPNAPFLQDAPMKVYPLGLPNNTWDGRFLLARFGYSPAFIPWLRRNVGNYDCIIVNGIWDYAAVGAAQALPSLNVPYFVFTHGMLDPWFRRRYPFKHLRKQLFWWIFQGPLLRKARRVFFTTEEERVLARNAFLGFNDYRGEVVGYGTADVGGDKAAQIAAFRAATPKLGDRPFLLFLSRIHPKKGCDLLVRAFAKIAAVRPELDLVIAGPDQEGWGEKLKRIAADAGVADRIHWPGMLSGDLKWGAFRGAEAFVLTSHQENFGIVVAEALACSTPVLITDKVNIWREVQAAGGGLVGPDDQAGADGLLSRWVAMDEGDRARMREAARVCFERHFDVTASAVSLVDSIKAAL
jgi:glycosyltransferase involved in cell wall biosynthesis